MNLDCPICEIKAEFFDIIPFSMNVDLIKIPIDPRVVTYYKCPRCGFIYCPEMSTWDLGKEVYNDEYIIIDPEYTDVRSTINAKALKILFPKINKIKHLDYGCGNNQLSNKLTGWDTTGYDPFSKPEKPESKFNLITAFEVFEHSSDINYLMTDLKSLLDREGVIVFSTVLDSKKGDRYIAPRNGHISIFSTKSLKYLAIKHNLFFSTITENLHVLQPTRNNLKRLINGGQ